MNSSYAYAEVLEVLENMEDIYVKKVPPKFIEFLKENASKDYQKHIVTSKTLDAQDLNAETLNILALINLKYWVESEEHKKELLAKYKENEKKKIERLSQHFDSSTIFDKTKSEAVSNNANVLDKSTAKTTDSFNNISKEKNDSEQKSNDFENNKINDNNLPVVQKSIFKKIIDYFKEKFFNN